MAKLQRWIDLTAALLRRNGPATLEDLVHEVPGYQHAQTRAALRRMFERDKVELRAFGIPIVTEEDGSGEVTGYRLRRDNFYLPYLSLVEASRRRPPSRARPDAYGYKALPELAFEADELEAVVEAARRVQAMGDANLAELARSVMRKLAFDLPVDVIVSEEVLRFKPAADLDDVLALLDEALAARKRVTITYYSMASDRTTERVVHPYGLFFLGSTWYLAALDGDRVKNFRVSRITSATVNAGQPGTPDYAIPPEFQLEDHARSKQAWELGDAAAVEVVVEFRGTDGAASAARRLGDPVPGAPSRRQYRVRRSDAFARWLLSLGGAAVPLSPPGIVDEYRRLVDETMARYSA